MRPTRAGAWGRGAAAALIALAALLLAGCSGAQSALDPAGTGAESIAALWWCMAAGALLIWAAVVGLAIYVIRARPDRHDERSGKALIIGGGAVFPVVVLGALLAYALSMLPGLLEPGPADGLRIEVTGEAWWWRVVYHEPGRPPVELANEIRLPVGRRVEVTLRSADVIHAFWIPSLGGKIDMIPGRVTRMALEPTRTGEFRGTCAEYCGASHAYMSFPVVVMEEAAFGGWLAGQREPAEPAAGSLEAQGAQGFLAHGCGACHTVRGTEASGVVGPDLTHVGSRLTLAAGRLDNDREAFARWIEAPEALKPRARMPSFGILPASEIQAIAAYLDSLR